MSKVSRAAALLSWEMAVASLEDIVARQFPDDIVRASMGSCLRYWLAALEADDNES